MRSYHSYKQSNLEWFGDIPNTWELKKIAFISDILTGFPFKSEKFDYENGLRIVRGDNVSEGFLRWGKRKRCWNSDEYDEKYLLKENDIVVSMDGSKVGKNYARIKHSDIPLLIHQRMCRIRPIEACHSKWLSYHIGSEMFRYYINITKTDPMIPHITQKNISDYKISIPNSEEIKILVSFLDSKTQKIDRLVELTQQNIQLLKEQRTALINQCATKGLNPNVEMKDSGVEWIGKIPKSWSMQKLKYLFDYQKGFAFKSSQFIDEGTPIVKASDIKKLTIRESNVFIDSSSANDFRQYSLSENDIILSTVGSKYSVIGSSVGQLAMVSKELDGSLLNQNTVRLKFKSEIAMSISYIFQVLQTRQFRSHLDIHSHGTANQASIDIKDILSFAFWQPLEFEQSQIAAFLDEKAQKIDSTIEKESQRMELLKEYRQSLISEVVTGKIDVRSYEE